MQSGGLAAQEDPRAGAQQRPSGPGAPSRRLRAKGGWRAEWQVLDFLAESGMDHDKILRVSLNVLSADVGILKQNVPEKKDFLFKVEYHCSL